jgi:hypothetical protein
MVADGHIVRSAFQRERAGFEHVPARPPHEREALMEAEGGLLERQDV